MDMISLLGATALAVLAVTFLIAIVRTLMEGVESFAAFDRAGFTFTNFIRGSVPLDAARRNPICIGDSAEIETFEGGIWATETRTVVKHLS